MRLEAYRARFLGSHRLQHRGYVVLPLFDREDVALADGIDRTSGEPVVE